MGRKILVADDSVTIQKVIKLALSSEGHDILAVSDGKEAVRAIEEERPNIVLIDIALSGANAYEVKRILNQKPHLSSIGFILLASAFERVDEKAAQEVGFHGRLIKPFDPSHLRKMILDVCDKMNLRDQSHPIHVPPEPPKESSSGYVDLPPIQDMHPTIHEEAASHASLDLEEQENDQQSLHEQVSMQQYEQEFEPDEDHDDAVRAKEIENDIKGLTESTIQISSSDDFQWSLEDKKRMKAPAPPPPSSVPKTTQTHYIASMPTAFPGLPSVPSRLLDDGGSTFLNFGSSPKKPAEIDAPMPPPAMATHHSSSPVHPITRAEIEQMIRKDMEAAIEKLAREVVPQVAEAMIRKEIEKILSEP